MFGEYGDYMNNIVLQVIPSRLVPSHDGGNASSQRTSAVIINK